MLTQPITFCSGKFTISEGQKKWFSTQCHQPEMALVFWSQKVTVPLTWKQKKFKCRELFPHLEVFKSLVLIHQLTLLPPSCIWGEKKDLVVVHWLEYLVWLNYYFFNGESSELCPPLILMFCWMKCLGTPIISPLYMIWLEKVLHWKIYNLVIILCCIKWVAPAKSVCREISVSSELIRFFSSGCYPQSVGTKISSKLY